MFADFKDRIRVATQGNEYSAKVAEATSEEPWGPTGPQMEELTNIFCEGRVEIVQELQTRLENRKSSWRKCYKSLLLIDHLLRNMSDIFIDDLRMMAPLIQTISSSFHYTDDRGVDHGLSVRERAKKVHELMVDDTLLREERAKAEKTRYNCAGIGSGPGITTGASDGNPGRSAGGATGGGGRIGSDFSTNGNGQAFNGKPRSTELRTEQENQDHVLAMKLQEEEERRAAAAAGGGNSGAGPHITPVPAGHQRIVAAQPVHQQVQQEPEPKMIHKVDSFERHQIDEDHRIALAFQRGEDPFANQSTSGGNQHSNTSSTQQQLHVRREAHNPTSHITQPNSNPVAPAPKPAPAAQPDLMSFLDDACAPTPQQQQQQHQQAPAATTSVSANFDPFGPTPTASSTMAPPANTNSAQHHQQDLFAPQPMKPNESAFGVGGNDFFSNQPTNGGGGGNAHATDLFAQQNSSATAPRQSNSTSFFDQPPQQPSSQMAGPGAPPPGFGIGQQPFAAPLGAPPRQPQQQQQSTSQSTSFFGGPTVALQPGQLGHQANPAPLGGGGSAGSGNNFEQQMAGFSGQKPAANNDKEKSLDQIMAEKRTGPQW